MKTVVLVLFAIVGCTTSPVRDTASGSDTSSPSSEIARYLAWHEGDYQNNYQVNREVASSKLGEWEQNPPALDDSDTFLEYLSLLDASGRHDQANKRIREFLVKYPQDKRGVFLLAVNAWRSGKKELSGYLFVQLEKENSFVWKSLLLNNLGMIALQDRNRVLAIDYFQKATKESPATAAPFVNLGALYLQSRSYAAAQPLFEKAKSLDPDFEDAAVGLGVALEGQGKFEASGDAYSDYISSHPTALSVVYNQSVLLGNRLGRREEAAQMMLRYIQRGGKETAKAQEIIQSWR